MLHTRWLDTSLIQIYSYYFLTISVPNPLDVNYSVDENLTITWTVREIWNSLKPVLF